MAGAYGHRRRTSEIVTSSKKAMTAPTPSRPHDGRRRRRFRSFRYGEQQVQRWPDRTAVCRSGASVAVLSLVPWRCSAGPLRRKPSRIVAAPHAPRIAVRRDPLGQGHSERASAAARPPRPATCPPTVESGAEARTRGGRGCCCHYGAYLQGHAVRRDLAGWAEVASCEVQLRQYCSDAEFMIVQVNGDGGATAVPDRAADTCEWHGEPGRRHRAPT